MLRAEHPRGVSRCVDDPRLRLLDLPGERNAVEISPGEVPVREALGVAGLSGLS